MKQLLILSGKGGTGKTTVAAAFIKLSGAKVYADCDVDAPNLHLVLPPEGEPIRSVFYGLPKALIDQDRCTGCGLCASHCRFGAIEKEENRYRINPFACEGCSVCGAVCPSEAVSFIEAPSGELLLYETPASVFSTAMLKMGSGASGKLVSAVKSQIKEASASVDLVVADGSPGIGCPVIASLSGADLVLIVAEPSLSGISDMERIIKTAGGFGTQVMVCINKYDSHRENSQKIEAFCREQKLAFAGTIPFDPEVIKAVNSGRTIVEKDCPAGRAVKKVFEAVISELFYEERGG